MMHCKRLEEAQKRIEELEAQVRALKEAAKSSIAIAKECRRLSDNQSPWIALEEIVNELEDAV